MVYFVTSIKSLMKIVLKNVRLWRQILSISFYSNQIRNR